MFPSVTSHCVVPGLHDFRKLGSALVVFGLLQTDRRGVCESCRRKEDEKTNLRFQGAWHSVEVCPHVDLLYLAKPYCPFETLAIAMRTI